MRHSSFNRANVVRNDHEHPVVFLSILFMHNVQSTHRHIRISQLFAHNTVLSSHQKLFHVQALVCVTVNRQQPTDDDVQMYFIHCSRHIHHISVKRNPFTATHTMKRYENRQLVCATSPSGIIYKSQCRQRTGCRHLDV